MSRLSIIIPFSCDTPSEAFEETLASVLACQPDDSEILVADSGSYGDPWNINNEGVKFLSFPHCSTFLETLNETIRSANGSIIHILYAGTTVSENWTQTPLEHFGKPSLGMVIPAVFDHRKSKRVFALGVVFSRGGSLRTVRRSQFPQIRQTTIAPHVSAVFFRKSALRQIGLFESSFISQIAYVDAAFMLHECGWTSAVDLESRIFVRPNMLPATSPFAWAKQLERLYFRWIGRQTSLGAVGPHIGAFVADFWRHFPRLKAFQSLLGRLVGLVSLIERNAVARRLQSIVLETPLAESPPQSREAA